VHGIEEHHLKADFATNMGGHGRSFHEELWLNIDLAVEAHLGLASR
jgi:hypothetical protein